MVIGPPTCHPKSRSCIPMWRNKGWPHADYYVLTPRGTGCAVSASLAPVTWRRIERRFRPDAILSRGNPSGAAAQGR